MTKKLRKMRGDRDAPCTQALLNLIDERGKPDVCRWCIDYAKTHFLPIFERRCPGDDHPRKALNAAREYLEGKLKFSEVKDIIWYDVDRADIVDPAMEAAENATGQAASVVRHPSRWHAIAVYFYGAAAVAYDKLGLEASDEQYGALAEQVCADMTKELRSMLA